MNAVRAALAAAQAQALADVIAARTAVEAEMATIRAEAKDAIAAARAEGEKTTEDELEAGFIQGYFDLRRRVTLAHLEWDLSAFSGVDSDYWDAEVSIRAKDPLGEVGVGSARGENPTVEVGEVDAHTIEKTQATD